MRFTRHPQHPAIVGDLGHPFSLIHACADAGRCVEHSANPKWRRRIVAAYSFRAEKSSAMAQLAVAAAGGAVGSLFGAPQGGRLVGSFIGGQLFAGQSGKVEGPRLGDLQIQASTYGMGIPEVYGSVRIAGKVIWAKPLIQGHPSSDCLLTYSEIYWRRLMQ